MNSKKAGIGWEYLIAAGLVIFVVVAILIWGTGAFKSIANSLGFDVGLNQPQDDEAERVFVEEFSSPVLECKESLNVSCFCDLTKFSIDSLPNGYALEFSDESGSTKIVLKNNKNGKVAERWLTKIKPCVTGLNGHLTYLSDIAKDKKMKITFGDINKLRYELQSGGEFEASVSKSNFLYKREQDVFCVVLPGYTINSPTCS